MKRLANFVLLIALFLIFACLAGIMYGHKYYTELVSGIVSDFPYLNYERKRSGIFSEEGYFTVTAKSDVSEFQASFFISVQFFPTYMHTDIYYVNSTADPLFLDYISSENETRVLSQDFSYSNQDVYVDMEISSHKIDFAEVEFHHSPIHLKFSRTNGESNFELFVNLLKVVADKCVLIIEDFHHKGNVIKFKTSNLDLFFDDGEHITSELQGIVIGKDTATKFFAEADMASINIVDAYNNAINLYSLESPNADADIDTSLWTDYNYTNFSYESFIRFLSSLSVKLYIYGGRSNLGETFDIVYSSGKWCSFCGINEGVLRIFAKPEYLKLFGISSKYSLRDNVDNVILFIKEFESVKLSEK